MPQQDHAAVFGFSKLSIVSVCLLIAIIIIIIIIIIILFIIIIIIIKRIFFKCRAVKKNF